VFSEGESSGACAGVVPDDLVARKHDVRVEVGHDIREGRQYPAWPLS
jgi:hypothetical protein